MNYDLNFSDDVRPLAARMRPRNLDEYIGQKHLLAVGKPLRRALEQHHLHSMILWGSPGIGKTTLAELMAKYGEAEVLQLSAVTSGIKEIRAAMDKAQEHHSMGRKTLLFVDEVHRFNKSQQDAFLPFIENGTVIFVGATTENPSFELNNALLSRARVYRLTALTADDIEAVLDQALNDKERGLGNANLQFEPGVKRMLAEFVQGDARMSLNFLEILSDFAEPDAQGVRRIDVALLAEVTGEKIARFDRQGDLFYDMLSALHKSIRGSSPDGGLYWYARLLQAGCDPLVVARRLLAIASEDVGNADPRAMQIAVDAWDCFTRVGAFEGERAIAQAVVFLACAAKSNAVYTAFSAAKEAAAREPNAEVPLHLRNAPTKLMQSMGHGKEYRYAHNEVGAYAAGECYLPEQLADEQYYFPTDRGLEKQIGEKLRYLAELDAKSPLKRYQ